MSKAANERTEVGGPAGIGVPVSSSPEKGTSTAQRPAPRSRSWKRRILQGFLKAVFFTLAFVVILELGVRAVYLVRNSQATYVPLPYALGDDYGPVPPWLEDNSILAPDKDLIWRNRPNLNRRYVDLFNPVHTGEERSAVLRRFRPSLPGPLKGYPIWDMFLNSDGFRDAEPPEEKSPSALRIICLGDSWTFGVNVGQTEAYPQRLAALLGREFPHADCEVYNRGVMGYSSHQGLRLLRQKGLDLQPDVVVIAFAMNDSKVHGLRDKDWIGLENKASWTDSIAEVVKKTETYRLLKYLALLLKHQPKSVGDHLRARAASAAGEVDFAKLEPWTRVSPADYEQNVQEMIRVTKDRGARAILLYNEFWKASPYQAVLEKLSQSEQVPLVDSRALIAAARKKIEEDLERQFGLEPVPTSRTRADGKVEVVFRVYTGKRPVPKAMYIAGAHPELGDLTPNKVAMYDDGTHGDQKAGDGVWTYTAAFAPGTKLFYVYTNSGEEGKWEGLDVPYIREFQVEAKPDGGTVYRPIECFGKIHMQADAWHTNALGYELIAKAVLEVLKQDEKFKEHVRLKEGP